MTKSQAIKIIDSMIDEDFTPGMVVKAYRKKVGFTQKQLGEISGICGANISAIETDRVPLGYSRALMLASALSVHSKHLLFPGDKWSKSLKHKAIEKAAIKLYEKSN